IAGVTPTSLRFDVPEGGRQQAPLTLSNTGGSDLTFNVGRIIGPPSSPALLAEDIHRSATLPRPDATRTSIRAAAVAPAVVSPLAGETRVLVIADGGTQTDVVPLLTAAGYTVTQVADDSFYDGSNPPLTGFKLVVVLDGPGVTTDMPA